MRVQASLLLPGLTTVEELRRFLDPTMAQAIAPHATLIYDDEAPLADLLVGRLRAACAKFPPITLQLDELVPFRAPDQGLFVSAHASAGFDQLRSEVLVPPFSLRRPRLQAHVTILHPRSAAACNTDWRSHAGLKVNRLVAVAHVSVIELNNDRWQVREAIPLTGSQPMP